MPPLVSIITPSFNQARYLEATLQSVLKQDYPAIEYIVVDGASTDGSPALIQGYADSLAWWVSESDRGQADAINKGFQQATGEILAWLNSDDLYLPGAVTAAVAALERNPEVGLVYGNALTADAEGRLLNELSFRPYGIRDLLQFQIICQPAVFLRRSALDQVGYLDSSYHFFLDHQLWIRLARHTRLLHQPQTWAVSRYHPDAKNVTMAATCGQEVWRILEWAEGQPDLQPWLEMDRPKILAGAHQISARYLLDGGQPAQALRGYILAAKSWPGSLRSYWHRMLFAALSLLGLGFLGKWYYSIKSGRQNFSRYQELLGDWPGIRF